MAEREPASGRGKKRISEESIDRLVGVVLVLLFIIFMITALMIDPGIYSK